MAINSGAAGKLLFAFEPPEADRLALPPSCCLHCTTTTHPEASQDPKLRASVWQGWAHDRGESAPSIHAFAAPIRDRGERVLAAVSIPFLNGTKSDQIESVRLAVISLADEINAAVPC